MTIPHTTVGAGPHRVMTLHGWFGSARGWGSLPDHLDRERFTYAFFDYRGYGLRRDVGGEFTTAEIAADAVQLAGDLGWDRFSVVGHSMGGKAALRLLVDAPGRVDRIVAVTPVPPSGVPFDSDTERLFQGAAQSADNRRTIIDVTSGSRLTRVWLDQMVAASERESAPGPFAAYLRDWAGHDFADQVKGDPTPTRVIVGEHDPSLTEAVMRQTYLSWLPAAAVEVMANAGHYPMFETPVALATSIESFLAGSPGPAT